MGPIVFFDGVCNLCNRSVDFIIRRDPRGIFRFSSLQSEIARQYLNDRIDGQYLSTIVLLKDERVFYKSNAVLEIVKHLKGLWPILYVFKLVPGFFRDAVYDLLSKNRYRWFGKRDTCRVPNKDEASRFLNDQIDSTMA